MLVFVGNVEYSYPMYVLNTAEGDFLKKYECNIPYNSDTYRVKDCPKCHTEIFSNNAEYCRTCGLDLVNKCTPSP